MAPAAVRKSWAIANTLKYISESATEEDELFLYIASHGVEISSVPYLLTADTRMNVVKETAIDTNEVNDILKASSARCVVRFFDACRSPFGIARTPAGRMSSVFEHALFATATGWATVSSCSTGEYSYESGDFEQGVFSYYLCEGICGRAANSKGLVRLS
ncbi:caspase family protein [Aeoliella mucimassa]|uniref:caspase family protein n=1 Tax=Aeoliella mucimassa TaxID=2527972 RepID=UPI00119F2B5C